MKLERDSNPRPLALWPAPLTLFPISALAASKHPFPELAANKSAPQNFSEIAANELGFPN